MKWRYTTVLTLALFLLLGLTLTACGKTDAAEEEESYDISTITYDAGEFITNVKDSKKMLSSAITMDLISQSLADILAEKDYVARDIINRQLSQLTEADLEKADILSTLSDSLVEALNEALNTRGFYKVYFVRFVWQ